MTGEIDAGMAQQSQGRRKILPTMCRRTRFPRCSGTAWGEPTTQFRSGAKLLKVSPQNGTSRVAPGRVAELCRKKYPEAAQEFEDAAESRARQSSTLSIQLGSAYLKMGRPDKAVVQIRAAVEERWASQAQSHAVEQRGLCAGRKQHEPGSGQAIRETAAKQLDEQSPEESRIMA